MRGDVPLRLTEDAYSLSGDFSPEWQSCEIPACLDYVQQTKTELINLPPDAARILDWTVTADTPFVPAAQKDRVVTPVNVNLLYWDSERSLKSKALRCDVSAQTPDPGESSIRAFAVPGTDTSLQGGQLELPVQIRLQYDQSRPMRNLCGGSISPASPQNRASLSAARCEGDLWEIAKARRTTVQALQTVNGLETERLEEPRLLLIPLGQAAKTAGEVKK